MTEFNKNFGIQFYVEKLGIHWAANTHTHYQLVGNIIFKAEGMTFH